MYLHSYYLYYLYRLLKSIRIKKIIISVRLDIIMIISRDLSHLHIIYNVFYRMFTSIKMALVLKETQIFSLA